MLSETFLEMMRCPEDRSELTLADASLLARTNSLIASGRAISRGGRKLERPIDAGLVRAAGDVMYPVVEGIPRLLIDEGIVLPQLESAGATAAPIAIDAAE